MFGRDGEMQEEKKPVYDVKLSEDCKAMITEVAEKKDGQ